MNLHDLAALINGIRLVGVFVWLANTAKRRDVRLDVFYEGE